MYVHKHTNVIHQASEISADRVNCSWELLPAAGAVVAAAAAAGKPIDDDEVLPVVPTKNTSVKGK